MLHDFSSKSGTMNLYVNLVDRMIDLILILALSLILHVLFIQSGMFNSYETLVDRMIDLILILVLSYMFCLSNQA